MGLSPIQLNFLQKYLNKDLSSVIVPSVPDPTPPDGDPVGTPDVPTVFGKDDADSLLKDIGLVRSEITTGLGSAHKGYETVLAQVETDLTAAKLIVEEAAFQRALATAESAINAEIKKLQATVQERGKYLTALAQAEALSTSLKGHPQYAKVEGAKRLAVDADLTKAREHAVEHDYGPAMVSLSAFDTKRREALTEADKIAKFAVLLQARKDRLVDLDNTYNALYWPGPGVPPAISSRHADAQKLVADAEVEGFSTGTAKLDQFAKEDSALRTQLTKAQFYLNNLNWVGGLINDLTTRTPPFIVGTEAADLAAAFGRAEVKANGGDLDGASDILKQILTQAGGLHKRRDDWDACAAEIKRYEDMAANWTGFVTKGGNKPEDTLFARYELLLQQAKDKFAINAFGAVFERIKELKKITSELNMLNGGIAASELVITTAEVSPEKDYLESRFIEVKEMQVEADRLKTAGKFAAAQDMVDQIKALLDRNTNIDKTYIKVADDVGTEVTNLMADMDANGAAALTKFGDLFAQWAGQIPAGFSIYFGDTLTYAVDHIQDANLKWIEANTALNVTVPAEPAIAKTAIDDGIALFKIAVQNCQSAFATIGYHERVSGRYGATKRSPVNTTLLDEADVLMNEALTEMKAHKNKDAAEKLKNADKKIAEAAEKHAQNDSWEKSDAEVGYIGHLACDMASISSEMAALGVKQTQIQDAWNRNDMGTAMQLQDELSKEAAQAYLKGAAAKVRGDILGVRGIISSSGWPAKHAQTTLDLDAIEAKLTVAEAKGARGFADATRWDAAQYVGDVKNLKARAESCNYVEGTSAAVEIKVDALAAPRDLVMPNSFAASLVKAVRTAFDAAAVARGKSDFGAADQLLRSTSDEADKAVVKLAEVKVTHDKLIALRDRRKKTVPAELAEVPLDVADEHIARAAPLLDSGDLTKCESEIALAAAQLDTADQAISAHKALADDTDAARKVSAGSDPITESVLAPLIAKAELALGVVTGRTATMEGQKRWEKAITAKLSSAKSATGKAAADFLAECFEMIANAQAEAENFKAFLTLKQVTETELLNVRNIVKGGDFVAPERATVEKLIGLATRDAELAMFSSAFTQLRSAELDLAAARTLAENAKAYEDRYVGGLKARIKSINEHDHRFSVAPEIDDIDAKAAKVDSTMAARDANLAINLVDELEALVALCEMKLKVSKGEAPDEDVLKNIASLKGGTDYLDKYVTELDPRIHREALINVTKARFGLDMVAFHNSYNDDTGAPAGPSADGTNVPAINLRAMYDIMKGVPNEYTKENKSLRELRRYDEENYSFYESRRGGLAMRCGRATDDSHFPIGAPWEIDRNPLPGEVRDPGAVVDHVDPTTPQPSFFTWQTWHELAHSIDDKLGFMATNQQSAKYGGWQMHGSDVKAIADAVAAKFGCVSAAGKDYVEKVMLGRTPAPPDEAEMSVAARLDVHAWYEAVKTDSNVWDNGAASRANALGGRMYHEAYPNSWVSYELSQRASGVTGYQFRAPGEWFSEIYAAIKTGKLKPSHPAYAELSKF